MKQVTFFMSSYLDLQQLIGALQVFGIEASPYELHGTLCGLLCINPDASVSNWLSLLTQGQIDERATEPSAQLLTQLYTETVSALADNSLDFYPLLTENKEYSVQLHSIAQWSQGFLLGLAGIKSFAAYPAEVKEFVTDITAISQAEDYELAGDESDEETIMQLIEFIRIGVLLVNEEMNPLRLPIKLPEDESYADLPDDSSFLDSGCSSANDYSKH